MMRSAAIVVGVFCVATLLSQALAMGLLWSRGQLTAETLKDIRALLAGHDPAALLDADEPQTAQPSTEEVMKARVGRLFDIGSREQELSLFKTMLAETADGLAARQTQFEKRKREFEEQLARLEQTTAAEATEQARGILQALPPADAVGSLMPLPLEENVLLLKEMPEKGIARILQEFAAGDEKQVERGRKIFEALSRGEPLRTLIGTASERTGTE